MESAPSAPKRFVFPAWTNKLPLISVVVLGGLASLIVFLFWFYGSPKHTQVGYRPKQPVDYSHKLHAGDLGLDCRYCHIGVEKSAVATVPPTQICMNCHTEIKKTSDALRPIRESFEKNRPMEWVRVHKLPDYVYFDHSVHVQRGVGCVECHGRVDQMEVVQQKQPLSMGWCLDCHRNPAEHIRPPSEVTNMAWKPPAGETAASYGKKLLEAQEAKGLPVQPPEHCSGCHR